MNVHQGVTHRGWEEGGKAGGNTGDICDTINSKKQNKKTTTFFLKRSHTNRAHPMWPLSVFIAFETDISFLGGKERHTGLHDAITVDSAPLGKPNLLNMLNATSSYL